MSIERCILAIGHPGHELLTHQWMVIHRPTVLVLTDGSGGAGLPRIEETRETVVQAGGLVGPVFGAGPDKRFYEAILAHDAPFFAAFVDAATAAMEACDAQLVLSDAIEHFNPVHDLCCVIAALAARRAERSLGHGVAHWDFAIELQDGGPRPGAVTLALDDSAVLAKQTAAGRFPTLAAEVAAMVARHPALLRQETIRPVTGPLLPAPPPQGAYYEQFGRARVQGGAYAQLITYDDHLAPLARALAQWTRSLA